MCMCFKVKDIYDLTEEVMYELTCDFDLGGATI